MPQRICDVLDCSRPIDAKGMCRLHYQRWRNTGDPIRRCRGCDAEVLDGRQWFCDDSCKPRCSVDDCEQPARKRGWCAGHYAMWRESGEVRPFVWRWGEGGYGPTHAWLRRVLGAATEHRCVDCGAQAQEWSYAGTADAERDSKHGAFARDAQSYEPRCIRCHRIFDHNPIATSNA